MTTKSPPIPRAFEWDAAKAETNLSKHGLSFPVATRVWLDPGAIEVDVSRADDGEPRFKAVGIIDGYVVTIVFTPRPGGVVRIISARRANGPERRARLGAIHPRSG